MADKIKALTIGGATLDTIIDYEDMFTMDMQKKETTQSYMLLEEGAKVEVTEQKTFSGGGATNAAVSFKKQGIDASFFGKIGKDMAGDKIISELTDIGIDVSNVRRSNTYGTATSYVIPTLSGDRTIFTYRGANKDILSQDLPSEAIIASHFIYITSLSKSSAARLPEIVKLASDNGTKVAINPGSSQLSVGESFIKDSLFGVDILVLNYEEAQKLMLSLLSVDDDDEVVKCKNRLKDYNHNEENSRFLNSTFKLRDFFNICLDLGPKTIVVTDGGNGVYAATQEKLYHSKSLKIEQVVNTLGAGDAFSSTFCASIYKGMKIEEAIKYSLINSSHVIQMSDAKSGLQDMDTLEKIRNEMSEELDKMITIIDW